MSESTTSDFFPGTYRLDNISALAAIKALVVPLTGSMLFINGSILKELITALRAQVGQSSQSENCHSWERQYTFNQKKL